jgi:hypothetical protein
MKCKKCGHKSTTIGAMAAHYRKAHPGAMKAKKPKSSATMYKSTEYRRGQTDRVYALFADMSDAERKVMANLTYAYR